MLNINFSKSQRDIVTYLLAAESYPVAAAEASHQRVKPSPAEGSLSTHPAGGVAPRRGDISVSPTRADMVWMILRDLFHLSQEVGRPSGFSSYPAS